MSDDHLPLATGSEFDVIRAIVRRLGPHARGIGDDAAVLDVPAGERLVVSSDSAIENVHFRRAWLTPAEIGWRATMAALSDLAAMGATPLGALVALAAPTAWRASIAELMSGAGDAAAAAGAAIVGGNLSHADTLMLTTTAIGSAASPVPRSGARAHDALWVTGRLGGPALALRALERGEALDVEARHRFARPAARIAEGRWLAAQGAHAIIDVSDGIVADAGHLATASGVRVVLELDRVPRFGVASARDAATSGEEYELLVAADVSLDVAEFERRFDIPLTRVGSVREGAGVELLEAGARVAPLPGHDHFSR